MAFVVPTFNLAVNIFRGPITVFPPPGGPTIITTGNLTPGRRVVAGGVTAIGGSDEMFMLLPKGTDIRSTVCGVAPDVVEVPAGTGRYYSVEMVDDVARGFANEYRFAMILQIKNWPAPIP